MFNLIVTRFLAVFLRKRFLSCFRNFVARTCEQLFRGACLAGFDLLLIFTTGPDRLSKLNFVLTF